MPKFKSWPCRYGCENLVNEIGAYVKMSGNKYAHLHCHEDAVRELAQRDLLAVQAKQARQKHEQERRALEEQQARERAEAERRLEIAERERTNRIIAAQNNPLPPKIEPKKEEANAKQQEERPDRFKLIDLE